MDIGAKAVVGFFSLPVVFRKIKTIGLLQGGSHLIALCGTNCVFVSASGKLSSCFA
jgi:hypothetical protein